AATYSLRFGVFLTTMPILAATTDPQQMAQALSRTPIPAGMAMALLLIWRFFPVMAEEVRQMRRAALLHGNICDSFVRRIYRGLLVPIAFCLIEYTDRITLALELRGFTPSERRTCHRPIKAGMGDIGFALASLCAVGIAVWLQWGGPWG
ncbi:MAG: energy-coupling factor transporter transmembrane protein EcfT, partial [Deltaproteobacteria bacterium]|nr:energy-coupling factor transporter transmembrane protein EcfT [Deltaproteobacteria bacterium]